MENSNKNSEFLVINTNHAFRLHHNIVSSQEKPRNTKYFPILTKWLLPWENYIAEVLFGHFNKFIK